MALELDYPEIGLYDRKSISIYEMSLALMMITENPGERFISLQDVPTTASGPLGLKPLVNQKNVDKGSRHNRSVTSGKGLALTMWCRGP